MAWGLTLAIICAWVAVNYSWAFFGSDFCEYAFKDLGVSDLVYSFILMGFGFSWVVALIISELNLLWWLVSLDAIGVPWAIYVTRERVQAEGFVPDNSAPGILARLRWALWWLLASLIWPIQWAKEFFVFEFQ